MKKIFSMLLVLSMVLGLCACASSDNTPATTQAPAATEKKEEPKPQATEAAPAEEGKVFNIYAWNEEFKGFFEKYYTVPEGVTVNWIITPSNDGAYQDKLDEALLNQANAAADDKVDMLLAEADYIL